MGKSFLQRRHENPDYLLQVDISGVVLGDTGKVDWEFEIEGETDRLRAAQILDRISELLRVS